MDVHDRLEEGLVLGTDMLRSMELMNIPIIHPLWHPIWRGISYLELEKRNYDVAHDYCELARKNAVEILGSHHSLTLTLTHDLGRIALARSKHREAERYYREVIQTASHLVKYDSMVDLGYIFELREELEQAENMYQRGLNGYRKFLGSGHWVTCKAEKNLSNVQRKREEMHANVTTNNTTTRTSPSKELS
ncbi:hypothetical protein BS50DRAFT_650513 [Corynespora cassiicola Philippines]|uniref:Uncharacterized protein n=1 Tax=Corynespora cassiicola Philippines TaxID=1448308 RepID=A0A2T2N9L5_CORCC|nr:hypothetical protein BS50DRAFT_650513 [Corynespora cassiicola Philippines]